MTLLARPLLADLPVRVRPPDAAIVAIVAALLSTLALAACSVPARRAGRVDVVAVLKSD